MRISAGLRQRGVKTERWEKWRARTKSILATRSRGKCEITGAVAHDGLDGHHLMGRQDEPWSSHPAAMIAVSRQAHNDLENELLPALHDELRWGAVGAIAEEFGEIDWYRMTVSQEVDRPLDVWRRLIDRLRGLGWIYDNSRNTITRDA